MAKLILGPLLRRVVDDQAVLWFQTDAPGSYLITAGGSTTAGETFEIEGVHLAHVVLTNLPARTDYRISLDNAEVWPLPGNPASTISTDVDRNHATIAFGSCREPRPYGVDALKAYAERARKTGELPDLLAMIGDQIYADELSEQTEQWLATRDRPEHFPPGQVVAFDEYVRLYHEAWSSPEIRWLLSTVPTVMIFDDHEIIDDWNSSAAWLADMSSRPWWDQRIRAGMTSYWLFQHLGNLAPAELETDPVWQKLKHEQKIEIPPGYRWSYTVDLGRTRMIMLDCRANRVLDGPARRMFGDQEWDWLRDEAQADCDHLVLACSLPWLLAPAIHHLESVMEVLSKRYGGMIEKMRRRFDLEHWSAIGHSFGQLTELIQQTVQPATITVLGGDVHHSYVAKAFLPGRDNVYQVTCSPMNNDVSRTMKVGLKVGWWRGVAAPGRWVARLARIPKDLVKWKILTRPHFENVIGTLTFTGPDAEVLLEGPDGPVLAHRLNNAERR